MRHLISLKEQSKEDLLEIIHLAQELKAFNKVGLVTNVCSNKTLLMFFQKTSTRTRLSFEAAMTQLGGHAIHLDAKSSQLLLTDFSDEIRAIMRFGDIIMFRALRVSDVERAASFNQIPVIDGCSEKYHPVQSLGDMLTMIEYSKGIQNIKKVVWLGVENNVSNTLKVLCAKLEVPITIAAPEVDRESVDKKLDALANKSGLVTYTSDIKMALEGADYIHTDTWMNMEFFENGKIRTQFCGEFERRKKVFLPYQLSASLVNKYAPRARIMHCMPCHVGYEISRDAIDHKNSTIFDQAENRLHVSKGIITWLLDKK